MSNDAIRDMRAGADVDTLEGKVKLAIAIELDEMFITQGDGKYSLHPMFAKNFGEVRDRLYNAVTRVLNEHDPLRKAAAGVAASPAPRYNFAAFADWWSLHGKHNAAESGDKRELMKLSWEVARELTNGVSVPDNKTKGEQT